MPCALENGSSVRQYRIEQSQREETGEAEKITAGLVVIVNPLWPLVSCFQRQQGKSMEVWSQREHGQWERVRVIAILLPEDLGRRSLKVS